MPIINIEKINLSAEWNFDVINEYCGICKKDINNDKEEDSSEKSVSESIKVIEDHNDQALSLETRFDILEKKYEEALNEIIELKKLIGTSIDEKVDCSELDENSCLEYPNQCYVKELTTGRRSTRSTSKICTNIGE